MFWILLNVQYISTQTPPFLLVFLLLFSHYFQVYIIKNFLVRKA